MSATPAPLPLEDQVAQWRQFVRRRRRYYRITKDGRAELAAQRRQWQVVDETLRGIWMKAQLA